ncbi:MAG TPA: SGNH/GDSL hydrolase family protein [Streptosporangiaceae bacterium]|nr:SGNH/GDSL hydrolase family protein [Streptosporangiaceae bacterium]
MDGRAATENTGSFLALGDSFTEGLNDRTADGQGISYRGWADRFADLLAADQPGLRYANLAIRGKLLGEVAEEQVPRAIELRPDLVSIAAGGNDILRPGSDPDVLAQTFDAAVADLRAAGCRVLLFTGFDPSAFPVIRMLRGKVAAYNMHLRTIAAARDCVLVDLWSMRILVDRRMWSADRLHLNSEGHRRVALFVAERAGVPVTADWREPLGDQAFPGQALPGQVPRPVAGAAAVAGASASAGGVAGRRAVARVRARFTSARGRADRSLAWMSARQQDTRWAVEYAVPWVRRRLTHRSSGDHVPPKRPELMPLDALTGFGGPDAPKSACS